MYIYIFYTWISFRFITSLKLNKGSSSSKPFWQQQMKHVPWGSLPSPNNSKSSSILA